MPDRSSNEDPLVRSWREQLERLRREEEHGWAAAAEERPRAEPSSGDGDGDGTRRSRGWETAIGALVLLVGVAVAYLVVSGRLNAPGGPPADDGTDAASVPAAMDSAVSASSADADVASSSGPSDTVPPPADTTGETDVPAPAEPDTAGTPELLDLFLGDSTTVARAMEGSAAPEESRGGSALIVRPGSPGTLWVGVRGGEGRPRAGVELVLAGSDRLPGVEGRLEVTTDGRGRAVFRIPTGEVRDTVAMDVLARGYWLRGTNRVVVRPVP